MIDHIAAEVRLGQRKKSLGQSGRPSEKATVREIWLAARKGDDWPLVRSAQVDEILRSWPSDGSRPPARGTIENHIRSFEQEADTGNE